MTSTPTAKVMPTSALTLEPAAAVATPCEPPPPFVSVEISPRVSSLPGAATSAQRTWPWARFFYRANATAPASPGAVALKKDGVIFPILRFVLFLALLLGTASGYAVALLRFNEARAQSGPFGRNSSDDDGTDPMTSTPTFLHACFAMALLLELVGLWRTFRTLIRIRLYRKPAINEWLAPEELTEAEASPRTIGADVPETPRLVRALFGAPPKNSPLPTLPTYETALQQGARQAARREVHCVVPASRVPLRRLAGCRRRLESRTTG
jgi:hypothetical protein